MDIAALRKSWATVAKSGDEVPLHFYSHLFLSNPELRSMFPISMSTQRDKLVSALARIISNIEQLDEVVPFIEQLGRDHRRFSVVAEHYDAVGASLLATMQHFLANEWAEPLAADWAAAYGLVAKVMVEAAEQSEDAHPAWWEADVVALERRTVDVTMTRLVPTEPFDYRPGQSFAMQIPQRPRLWRYFSPANAPRPDGSIDLHVQQIDGGQVSGGVARQLRTGDRVRLGAPVGEQLTRDSSDRRDLLLIAGGSGLAPLTAVVDGIDREFRETGSAPEVHLFHGARVPWNLYDRARLRQLAAERPWFAYSEVVSDDPSYPGEQGVVGAVAARNGPWRKRLVMVCGGQPMVSNTRDELAAVGAHPDDVRYEQFHTYDGALPAAADNHPNGQRREEK
jgi:NAD(P)H-flavin reductase/hemoglobin-like flavoprotein